MHLAATDYASNIDRRDFVTRATCAVGRMEMPQLLSGADDACEENSRLDPPPSRATTSLGQRASPLQARRRPLPADQQRGAPPSISGITGRRPLPILTPLCCSTLPITRLRPGESAICLLAAG